MLGCVVFFAIAFCFLILFTVFHTVMNPLPPARVKPAVPASTVNGGLSKIPKTVAEVATMMTDTEFEAFAAAVVIGLGEGHTFQSITQQSRDQGVDAILLNVIHQTVVVQAKRYNDNKTVGSPEIRNFSGSILHYDAIYGYLVTTSTVTSDGQDAIRNAGSGRVRIINKEKLEYLLQTRGREIALAYNDILRACAEASSL